MSNEPSKIFSETLNDLTEALRDAAAERAETYWDNEQPPGEVVGEPGVKSGTAEE